MERRDFLKVLGATAAGGVLLDCGGWSVNPAPNVKASAPDLAGRILFAPDQYSQLTKNGGSVMVNATGVTPILVMRIGDNDFRATSGLCSHVQCPVGYVPDKQLIECPCHGARFSVDGHVLRKPATSALIPYAVRTDADTGDLYIDTRGTDVPAVGNGGVIEFAVSDLGTIDKPDDFYTFTPTGLDRPITLVRYATDQIVAADAICTFATCVLTYSVDRRRYSCPCHGCEFSLKDGTVTEGPATKPLRVFAVNFDGTTCRITVPAT